MENKIIKQHNGLRLEKIARNGYYKVEYYGNGFATFYGVFHELSEALEIFKLYCR
jgi:hypothetical protein